MLDSHSEERKSDFVDGESFTAPRSHSKELAQWTIHLQSVFGMFLALVVVKSKTDGELCDWSSAKAPLTITSHDALDVDKGKDAKPPSHSGTDVPMTFGNAKPSKPTAGPASTPSTGEKEATSPAAPGDTQYTLSWDNVDDSASKIRAIVTVDLKQVKALMSSDDKDQVHAESESDPNLVETSELFELCQKVRSSHPMVDSPS